MNGKKHLALAISEPHYGLQIRDCYTTYPYERTNGRVFPERTNFLGFMCYHIFLSMDAPQELHYNDISEDMTKLCIGQGILAVLPGNTVTTNEKKKKTGRSRNINHFCLCFASSPAKPDFSQKWTFSI